MDSLRWQKIEKVFNATLSLPHPQREVYLNSACSDDAELRRELDLLLIEADQPDQFLSESNFALGAQILSTPGAEAAPGDRLGNYQIVRPIGRGGMGEVYLAHDERLGRRVAIKLLPQRLIEDKERVRRFKHEARAASSISDPNVAHIYEIGEADGRLFTVMEYVTGSTLRELMARREMLLGTAVDIATQVCSAIIAAHAQGIIHRDIKPENIIIRPDGLVKVVDFGLAKLTELKKQPAIDDSQAIQLVARVAEMVQTEPGLLMGTATYMSPEQARGQDTDSGTDIWSWGVVFYEMLTGQAPFSGATNSDIIAELLKSDPSFDLPIFDRLPQSITAILRCALNKDRSRRYSEISEVNLAMRALRVETNAAGVQNLLLTPDDGAAASERPGRGIAEPPIARTQDTRTSVQSSSDSQSAIQAFFRRRKFLLALLSLIPVFILFLAIGPGHIFRKQAQSRTLQIIHLTDDGRIMDAAISPDGRLLAYVPIAGGKQSLRIRDLDSEENWELLPPDPALCWGMRFALNNQSIFYVSKQPGSTVSVLYRIPVRGGPSQKLVVNIDSPPGLSPDNMQLAFVRSYPGQHRDALIIANVDGSDEREILARAHPDRLALSGVTWSSDGKMIAAGASRRDETEAAVLGVPVSGGAPVELTPWKWSAIRGVVWKNDGRTILFSAHLPGSNALQIWRLSYPDKVIDQLTTDDNEYEEATLGPNALVATHTYEVSDLWTTDESSDHFQSLTSDSHNGADGLTVTRNKIIYTVGEYSASQLWSMNFDGSDRRVLTNNSGVHPSATRSGDLIAYVSSAAGAHHVWLVNSDGQNNHQLTAGEAENYPSLSPDGEWVFYVSRAQNRGTLWKIPTLGGPAVQLTFAGIILNPVVSPDGKKIACTYRADEGDRWKIAILPIDGGAPQQTFALPSSFYQIIRWTSDSSAITYLDKHDGAQNIWRQPINGGAAVQLTQFKEDSILHYAWATEHRFIVSRGGRRRDVVMMKNID